MTATATKPRPLPTAALAIWWLIPLPIRTALRARVPLDCREVGERQCLIVSVGSGMPLRWLHLEASATGEIVCRLWEVRQKTKELASATVHPDRLAAHLQVWAREHGLSA